MVVSSSAPNFSSKGVSHSPERHVESPIDTFEEDNSKYDSDSGHSAHSLLAREMDQIESGVEDNNERSDYRSEKSDQSESDANELHDPEALSHRLAQLEHEIREEQRLKKVWVLCSFCEL